MVTRLCSSNEPKKELGGRKFSMKRHKLPSFACSRSKPGTFLAGCRTNRAVLLQVKPQAIAKWPDLVGSVFSSRTILVKKESTYRGRIYVRPRAFTARGACYNCGGVAFCAMLARDVGE